MTNGSDTVFGGAISFLDRLGVYDIILPFLLVFTITFAILERTKIFGEEKIKGEMYTKKSINSLVAFVVGFMVVASAQLVSVINAAIAQIALLLVLLVMFLLLVGVFYNKDEDLGLSGSWRSFFMVLIFIAIVLIFLNSVGFLGFLWTLFVRNTNSDWVPSLILVILLIIFMVYITRTPKGESS